MRGMAGAASGLARQGKLTLVPSGRFREESPPPLRTGTAIGAKSGIDNGGAVNLFRGPWFARMAELADATDSKSVAL